MSRKHGRVDGKAQASKGPTKAVIRATREFYAEAGGDTWIAGKLPGLLDQAGLQTTSVHPNVICGGPGSAAFEWAESFFCVFAERYVEPGLLTQEELEQFREEWAARRSDPNTVFFSPFVVDVIARRP